MRPEIQAIAFDCYGTLIDVTDDSFLRACEAILAAHERAHESKTFWEKWLEASRSAARQAGRDPDNPTGGPEPPFARFRDRWPKNFERAFADLGINGDAVAAYEAFHDTLSTGVAFPDSEPALRALAPHYTLAVVSNADEDHLRAALAANRLPVDLVLSSETARSYKPRRPIFRQAAELLGVHVHDVLYVGDSPVADLLGARYAGMRTAWINRAGIERPAHVPKPDFEVRDLLELAQALLGGEK
ncbi:MAG: HAD-IA family hydrolase [Dehalococcoidia bacterium]